MKHWIFCIVFIITILLVACKDEKKPYRFSNFYSSQIRDTLLVDMVTLIGKKPKTADYLSRHEARFRNYYIQLAESFNMEYFHQADDTCYYYMIRPARSVRGNTRGVGGKFTLDANDNIDYFEESFNTPIYPREDLERIGWRLFRELIEKRSISGLQWNVDYIEWPDDRLQYDTEKREWRYDVADESLKLFREDNQ
jgi:hypothetical protein